jgi:hypothetical protein
MTVDYFEIIIGLTVGNIVDVSGREPGWLTRYA